MCKNKWSPRAEVHLKFSDQLIQGKIWGEKYFFSKWVMTGFKSSVLLLSFQKF
jgi:hypothetical protein